MSDGSYRPTEQHTLTNLQTILKENIELAKHLDESELDAAAHSIQAAKRIFVTGAGRSGLALKAAAMRLMHLGLHVHVVGEITTPAIEAGDLLIVASGSGTTGSAVAAAEKAASVTADITVFTTAPDSPLGKLATTTVVIPAAVKTDHGNDISKQYAGSLFEQAIFLVTDALFQSLWAADGTPAEQLWPRHANLE